MYFSIVEEGVDVLAPRFSKVHVAPSSSDCPVLAHPYAAQGTTHKNTAGDMNTHMNIYIYIYIYIQRVRTPTCRGAFKESGMRFSDAIKPISQPVSGKLVHKLVSGAQN